MHIQCSAPGCHRTVIVNTFEYYMNKIKSLFRGGSFTAVVFCPEHMERISHGKYSDNDPKTNPDLNK